MITREIIIRKSDQKNREIVAGMIAELDARPQFFDLDAFRENLIAMLRRQVEKLLATNKREMDNATADSEIMRFVTEDKRLKTEWIEIQRFIRDWQPSE